MGAVREHKRGNTLAHFAKKFRFAESPHRFVPTLAKSGQNDFLAKLLLVPEPESRSGFQARQFLVDVLLG